MLNISSDRSNNQSDKIFCYLPGVVKLVDDILIQATTWGELLVGVKNVLDVPYKHEVYLSQKGGSI